MTETATTIDSTTVDAVLGVLDGLDSVGAEVQREKRIEAARDWLDDRDVAAGGRAPLGFEWEHGELVPVDEMDHVCGVLELVDTGDLSKRRAADRLDASPRTITRCLEEEERRVMYGLD